MDDEAASPATLHEISDTQRPPPRPVGAYDHRLRHRSKAYPVTVKCETEEQRAMLHEWLHTLGYSVEQ
jgi:hypothetical protein